MILEHRSVRVPREGAMLDPKLVGTNPWTKADLRISSRPRISFTKRGGEFESRFSHMPVFHADVPDEKIYDLKKDHLGLLSRFEGRGWPIGVFIQSVLDHGFIGHTHADGDTVTVYHPTKVTPAEAPEKLSRESRWLPEGWMEPNGTFHENEIGSDGYPVSHHQTLRRLFPEEPSAAVRRTAVEESGWAHISNIASPKDPLISAWHPKGVFTPEQIAKIKALAKEHGVTNVSLDGNSKSRPLRLARFQAPSGGAVVNNTFGKGGQFLAAPRLSVGEVMRRLRGMEQKPVKLARGDDGFATRFRAAVTGDRKALEELGYHLLETGNPHGEHLLRALARGDVETSNSWKKNKPTMHSHGPGWGPWHIGAIRPSRRGEYAGHIRHKDVIGDIVYSTMPEMRADTSEHNHTDERPEKLSRRTVTPPAFLRGWISGFKLNGGKKPTVAPMWDHMPDDPASQFAHGFDKGYQHAESQGEV